MKFLFQLIGLIFVVQMGNMTALIGSEGTLLVDNDFAQMADKLLAKLKELEGSSNDLCRH
ncbi:MAG: hypothetical protein A4S09_05795 [Proteobacteria bacterium SG_bin7]|nr:MAG: hypothetical protein A4S09_05795 [Proteobacteria bacterium SG_bin7]